MGARVFGFVVADRLGARRRWRVDAGADVQDVAGALLRRPPLVTKQVAHVAVAGERPDARVHHRLAFARRPSLTGPELQRQRRRRVHTRQHLLPARGDRRQRTADGRQRRHRDRQYDLVDVVAERERAGTDVLPTRPARLEVHTGRSQRLALLQLCEVGGRRPARQSGLVHQGLVVALADGRLDAQVDAGQPSTLGVGLE